MKGRSPYFTDPERLSAASELTGSSLTCAGLTVASYRRDTPGLGLTEPNPNTNMFMAVVTLRDLPAHGGWRDGRYMTVPAMRPGSLASLDFRETWVSDLPHAFHTFHAFIPQTCFDELTLELRQPRIEALACRNTGSQDDPTMHGLALAMLPLIDASRPTSALVADHILTAIVNHLGLTYGNLRAQEGRRGFSLDGAMVRKVTELLLDTHGMDVSLVSLASACGLSVRQFQRAFGQAFGTTPHRWRAQQRVKLAKERLATGRDSLSEIAHLCGFADQSHFTRVFTQIVGVTPGLYRRRFKL